MSVYTYSAELISTLVVYYIYYPPPSAVPSTTIPTLIRGASFKLLLPQLSPSNLALPLYWPLGGHSSSPEKPCHRRAWFSGFHSESSQLHAA
ncbi:hypothetical protein MIND_01011600 [Mycena indigotica]|uniref:Uncharacterized protein n=1 Tax=Mycena indigotica TaxID=2126181 RepID=A0A8H6S9B0_9AGAR|nr:uncharacterized protein MIND_01011600 [Mycena indigotica]KAF7294742.1 hypothetical protein MIND_01011600 [Mycena indigotica]